MEKSITILFRYKINQRQIQQMDPIAINTISNGQQLIFMGQTTLSAMQVVMVILHPMKTMTIFIQAFTLGVLHILSCLSCTSTLHVTSYHFHLAQEKIEA